MLILIFGLMSPIFCRDLLMMVTTTFRHKTQDFKLKSYVINIVKNLKFYVDVINFIQITFEADSCRKGNAKYGCHISLHTSGIKNIDIKVICKYAKDAFDQAFNQLSNKLKHSVRHKKTRFIHNRILLKTDES
ncbi:MAG: ribosome-associated translation inhibitor RaiA [Alteromonadaceae bacterium]|jgi:ribosome-associated translation inhibitor RaiA